MKKLFVVLLFVLVLPVLAFSRPQTSSPEKLNKFSLLKTIDDSELVVVGTVIFINYVRRDNIRGKLTTDIGIRADTVVKGTPNLADNVVQFMIKGGQGVIDGRLVELYVNSQPKFKIGEKVMVFLSTDSDGGYYINYPHGGYHLVRNKLGKKPVKNNKVEFAYVQDGRRLVAVEFPLDVAVKLSKAFVANADAALQRENSVKQLALGNSNNRISLPTQLTDSLLSGANTILDSAEEE